MKTAAMQDLSSSVSQKNRLPVLLFTTFLVVAGSACSPRSTFVPPVPPNDESEIPAETPPETVETEVPPQEPPSYTIEAPTTMAGACFDVAAFHDRLKGLPSDAWIRRHVTGLTPSAVNTDGSQPRINFLSVLAFSSFGLKEMQPQDIVSSEIQIEQLGCDLVRVIDSIHGTLEYKINGSTPTSLTLTLQDPVDVSLVTQQISYEWINSNELKIREIYTAMDFCPDYKNIELERFERIRWGSPDTHAVQAIEQIDKSFFKLMSRALADLPEDLAALARNPAPADAEPITLTVDDLKRVKASHVRRDLQVCPYKSKPPQGEEPLPPDAGESPLPPDTGVDPTEPEGGETTPGEDEAQPPSLDILSCYKF